MTETTSGDGWRTANQVREREAMGAVTFNSHLTQLPKSGTTVDSHIPHSSQKLRIGLPEFTQTKEGPVDGRIVGGWPKVDDEDEKKDQSAEIVAWVIAISIGLVILAMLVTVLTFLIWATASMWRSI